MRHARRRGPGEGAALPARSLNDLAFRRGAESLLLDYARLSADRSAVLVYDPDVRSVSGAIREIASDAGIRATCLSAELHWTTIAAALADGADAVLFLESGESHHTRALLDHLTTAPRPPRAYRLFGAISDAIRHGFRRRRATLRRRNWNLIAQARRAGRLRVDSDLGTRLHVGLDRTAGWANTYGECADGYPGILPPAEVNTRSADVEGVLVADGAIGSNLGWPLDARLGAHPVTLRISQGRIVDVDCRRKLVRDLIEEFLRVPQCNEVVEIGIGTNDGIREFLPSDVLLNERVASFHLGVGSADAEIAEQNLHLDFMLDECRIFMGPHLALSRRRFIAPTVAPTRRDYDVPVSLHDAL